MNREDSTALSRSRVDELISFSLDCLPLLRLQSGLYCHSMEFGHRVPRGESLRYSLMVLLGMQRAAQSGFDGLPDLDELWRYCIARRASFTPGDIGLAIWADTRRDGSTVDSLVDQLEQTLASHEALASLVGMEIAWIVIGLAHAAESSHDVEHPLQRVTEHLQRDRRAASGMYFHDAASRLRRHLPNFATEIYTLLALSTLARNDLLAGALGFAETLAGHLVRLQLPDGGWPWLFDADRATVVERYEIYTVHQDAMAPMALLELTELTGDARWARAAVDGLAWSRGENELHTDLLDVGSSFAHRSIRRRPPLDRLLLAVNSAGSRVVRRPVVLGGTRVEVNRTCRPYHLGWILEAWAGQSDVSSVLAS